MKKVFIHIGTHKTGTTAFQNTLMKCAPELVENDGLLPVWMGKFPEYKNLASACTYNPDLTANLYRFISDKTKNGSCFIISAEGLSGISSNEIYSNTDVVARTLKEATKNLDPKIIVIFRRQDELIQSLFTQKKHQGDPVSMTTFCASIDLNHLNWNNFLVPWIECFGDNNVHVLPYDRAVFSRYSIVGLLNTVIKSTVLDKLENNDVINKNVGYSPAAINIADNLNPKLTLSQRKTLRRVLQKVGNKGVLEEYNILPRDEKQRLVDHFYESNAELATKYFLKPFGMSNFSEPLFVQNNHDTAEEVLKSALVELINNLEIEQHKTKHFPISFIMRISIRMRGFINTLRP